MRRVDLDVGEHGDDKPQAGQRGDVPGRPSTQMGRQVKAPPVTRGLGQAVLGEAAQGEDALRRVEPGPEQGPRDPQLIRFELWMPNAPGIFTIEAESYVPDEPKRMMNFYRGGDVIAKFKIPEGIWYGIVIRSA